MPKLSPNSVTLLDGNIVLSKRDESAKWQARFKIEGRWLRVTTKEKDLKDAKEKAQELYLEARFRAKNNIPVQTKRFKDVAKLAIDRMQKALDGGEGKKVYRDYIQATNNYLTPFFGAHHIDRMIRQLTDQELDRLLAAALAEQRRRGKKQPVSNQRSSKHAVEGAPSSLKRGQMNAVRAAFKAGVKPPQIAGQFGISQSDVRRALASEESER